MTQPAPLLVVQEIRTTWTKRSRSGEAAARRRATPRRLTLPRVPSAEERRGATLVHHVVACREEGGFSVDLARFDVRPLALYETLQAGCATVRFLGDRVEAVWAWSFSCGAPKRSEHPRTVLSLRPGQWGRVESNGRSSSLAGMAGWRYALRVTNVALLDEPLPEPFPGEPAKAFSALAHLR